MIPNSEAQWFRALTICPLLDNLNHVGPFHILSKGIRSILHVCPNLSNLEYPSYINEENMLLPKL